ncbi:MAG: hypothetical protein H0U18_07225 [Pyrinomonadaceae bacterium]|jgi:hypothetical protein|nr:hypothetical protein [Pyrinomonadaceae bacterium]
MLDAAEEMGINVLHPALLRTAFIEIFRESGDWFARGMTGPTGHFEKPTTTLLTAIDYAVKGLGPIDLETEERACDEISIHYGEKPEGMEKDNRRALASFIKRSKCRKIMEASL